VTSHATAKGREERARGDGFSKRKNVERVARGRRGIKKSPYNFGGKTYSIQY